MVCAALGLQWFVLPWDFSGVCILGITVVCAALGLQWYVQPWDYSGVCSLGITLPICAYEISLSWVVTFLFWDEGINVSL